MRLQGTAEPQSTARCRHASVWLPQSIVACKTCRHLAVQSTGVPACLWRSIMGGPPWVAGQPDGLSVLLGRRSVWYYFLLAAGRTHLALLQMPVPTCLEVGSRHSCTALQCCAAPPGMHTGAAMETLTARGHPAAAVDASHRSSLPCLAACRLADCTRSCVPQNLQSLDRSRL
jgi:hypothetical protein